jgi:hypothetical protein
LRRKNDEDVAVTYARLAPAASASASASAARDGPIRFKDLPLGMQDFVLTHASSTGSLPPGLHPDDLHIITMALSARRPAAPAARTAAASATAPAQQQPAASIRYGPAAKYAGDPGVVSWLSDRQYNEIVAGAYTDASQLLPVPASAATGSASSNSGAGFFLDPDTLSIVSHKPNKRPPITRMAQLQVALQNVRAIMASHLEGLALKALEPPTFPPPRPQPPEILEVCRLRTASHGPATLWT